MEDAYAVEERNGQRHILRKRRYDAALLEDLNHIDDFFGLEREGLPMTGEMLQVWAKERCVRRKSREDFGALYSLRRDFADWARGIPCNPSAETFQRVLVRNGFEVSAGFVSSLVLSSDMESLRR